jgi:phage-related protein
LPQLIQAGIDLFLALIEALPKIITTLANAMPRIITGIVDALVGNIDKIISAGVMLFIALIENLPKIIIEIVKAVPQIIAGIIKAFAEYYTKMGDIGANLLKGLWNGIADTGQWLMDRISALFGNVVQNIKNFFGIHSPSTLFAEIGGNMGKGIGVGFEGAMGQVGKEMQEAIPTEFEVEPDVKVNPDIDMGSLPAITADTSSAAPGSWLSAPAFAETMTSVVSAINAVVEGAFTLFMEPLREEFAGIRTGIEEAVGVLRDFSASTAVPSVIINNTFNGVTASDVPYMVDRANNALLRRLAT